MSKNRANILIVDDKESNIFSLRAMIEKDNLNIIEALSGNEALRILLLNDIDLVLLDVQMPEIDGFEVAKMIRDNPKTKDVPIIFITAIDRNKELSIKGYSLGAVDFIYKPIEKVILQSKVNVFINLFNQKKIIEEKNLLLKKKIKNLEIAENKIYKLAVTDHLTGLYNRRFFEVELSRLDVQRNYPLTIVIGDVNGLKLINDTLGHEVGDEVLVQMGKILKESFREDEIVARLGGDEFVIILPKTAKHDAAKVVQRVKDKIKSSAEELYNATISFGFETKSSLDMDNIFKRAEDHMYREKLYESPSSRGKTLESIFTTLDEKDINFKLHSYRVSNYCEIIAEKMGMIGEKSRELKTAGLLHDIGKIVIDISILNKMGELTTEEFTEVQRHPKVGSKILDSVVGMSDIAEYILSHHESWDGTGYPNGLKGEEIPIESRIITVADSYDAMTSERLYKQKKTHDEAILELINKSGTQFDSKVVNVFIEAMEEKRNVV
ncbi:diguanylate cyclase [Mycoplasmatota bacterium WC44]